MTYKVFTFNEMATFVCPKCENVKTIDASRYIKIKKKIKVNCKCPCGHSFQAFLERRNYQRKEITLPGIYSRTINSEEVEKGQIVVTDLSRSGMRFRPHIKPAFKIGDQLHIVFNLNDKDTSLIQKKALIMNISDEMNVGLEFCQKETYGKIGAYLFG
jgi:c-di-GMP-binding flagellar brake protein YcgR